MITYATYDEFPGWSKAPALLGDLIERERPQSVLEVGGGREPTLPVDAVRGSAIRYTVNDIDPDELALVDPAYDTLCADVSGPLDPELARQRFELIFSRMVNEHVSDGERYWRNLYALLAPGGLTVHCFATFYTLPFLVNRLAPDALTTRLQAFSFGRSEHHYEKFPARYSWCRGPSRRMLARLRGIGFEVEAYRAYYGHGYYGRLPLLDRLEQAKARWLVRHPLNALTSYAEVELRRPADR